MTSRTAMTLLNGRSLFRSVKQPTHIVIFFPFLQIVYKRIVPVQSNSIETPRLRRYFRKRSDVGTGLLPIEGNRVHHTRLLWKAF